jgi:hypothetical protein
MTPDQPPPQHGDDPDNGYRFADLGPANKPPGT